MSSRGRTCGSVYDIASSSSWNFPIGASPSTVKLQWSYGGVWKITAWLAGRMPSRVNARRLPSITHAASTVPATSAFTASRSPPT